MFPIMCENILNLGKQFKCFSEVGWENSFFHKFTHPHFLLSDWGQNHILDHIHFNGDVNEYSLAPIKYGDWESVFKCIASGPWIGMYSYVWTGSKRMG